MIAIDAARQPLLFPLPPVVAGASARAGSMRRSIPHTFQRPLWLDIDRWPHVDIGHLPPAAEEFRARLRMSFEGDGLPSPFGNRTHDMGTQLLPLVKRISYTQELTDGAFRLFLEYRACDKFPHYRLLWGDLLWGRVDIRFGNVAYGADIVGRPILPTLQARLAAYLIALGYRVERARLRPHAMELEETCEGDVLYLPNEKTDTREYRLFKIKAAARPREDALRGYHLR